MSVRVKICGITNLEDALAAVQAGADMLGFIFFPPSPRGITPEAAGNIVRHLREDFAEKCPVLIGVFVNETSGHMKEIMENVGLDLAQLSGDESPSVLQAMRGRAYKAVQPQSIEDATLQVKDYSDFAPSDETHPVILVDSYHPNLRGGTGELGDPVIISALRELSPRMMMAGGLTPENIADQVARFQPFAVDVASGVEAAKGKKDHAKVREFIKKAHGYG